MAGRRRPKPKPLPKPKPKPTRPEPKPVVPNPNPPGPAPPPGPPVPPPPPPLPEQTGGTLTAETNDQGDSVLRFEATEVLENWMVFNGGLVLQAYDGNLRPAYKGHGHTDVNGVRTVTIRRALYAPPPGPADFTVSLWPKRDTSLDAARYLTAGVSVGGDDYGFVLPLEVSGRVAFPGRVPRSLFTLYPEAIQADGILEDIRAAGVTHLEIGCFLSPGDNPALDTFEKWLAAWEFVVKPRIDAAVSLGFRLFVSGDDFLRFPGEQQWLVTCPWAHRAVRHVAAYLAATGVCDGIHVIDEAADPSVYPWALWVGWWREVEGSPRIAWPNYLAVGWETPDRADFASRYGRLQDWRPGAEGGKNTNAQWRQVMETLVHLTPASMPLVGTYSCMGPYYFKRVAGANYQPRQDALWSGGATAAGIVAQVGVGTAYGVSGWRGYAFDFGHWRNERLNTVPHSHQPDGCQTGCRPGDDRFPGVAAGYAFLAYLEPDILSGPHYEPTESGPWAFGRWGNKVFGVNLTERQMDSPNGPGVVFAPGVLGVSRGTVPAGGIIVWEV